LRENLRGRCLHSCGNHRHGYPPPSECHGGLIRTGLAACVTYLVREAARATAADAICVKTVIGGGNYPRAVTINVDLDRGGPAPEEVRSPFPLHRVTMRTQRYRRRR